MTFDIAMHIIFHFRVRMFLHLNWIVAHSVSSGSVWNLFAIYNGFVSVANGSSKLLASSAKWIWCKCETRTQTVCMWTDQSWNNSNFKMHMKPTNESEMLQKESRILDNNAMAHGAHCKQIIYANSKISQMKHMVCTLLVEWVRRIASYVTTSSVRHENFGFHMQYTMGWHHEFELKQTDGSTHKSVSWMDSGKEAKLNNLLALCRHPTNFISNIIGRLAIFVCANRIYRVILKIFVRHLICASIVCFRIFPFAHPHTAHTHTYIDHRT